MVKSKKSRKNTLHVIKKMSKRQAIKSNPFEVHVNKSKFNILGQKSKNDVGLPGVARNKAIQKRKVTLLQEYKVQDKSNKFFDKRIGEHNKNMTKEDKVMARFTAEKMRTHSKSLFNLDDDVVLTHQGRTLEEIEQFEDPRSDDEDEEDGRNGGDKLDADFVKQAHFGGGMLSVSSKDGEVSRKDLISQLISESKKRKAEKQLLKETTVKLTEQLDTDWKDLLPLMNPTKKSSDSSSSAKPPASLPPVDKNSFDYLVRELRYEATGKPSDKLKSEDEIVRQEKERLVKLEQERLRRMSLHDDGLKQRAKPEGAYKSADDLDDGFAIENVDDDDMSDDEEKDDTEEEEGETSEEEEFVDSRKEIKSKQNDNDERIKNKNHQEIENENDITENDDDENEETEIDGEEEDSDTDSFDDIDENETDDDDENSDDDITEEKRHKNDNDNTVEKSGKKNVTIISDDVEGNESDEEKEVEENINDEDMTEMKSKSKEKQKKSDETRQRQEKNMETLSVDDNQVERNVEKTKLTDTKLGKKKNLRFSDIEEKNIDLDIVMKNADKVGLIKKDEFETVETKSILKNNINKNVNIEMDRIKSNSEIDDKDFVSETKELGLNLPFTFSVPTNYEELVELFAIDKNVKVISIILERMIKVNHWTLGGENKIKLNQLVAFLLQYLDDSVDEEEPKRCWQVLNVLTPHLFDLTLMDPDSSGNYVRGVIQEKYESYIKNDRKCPSVDVLLFLKLASSLFPTSDARHYVTTPAMVFLLHMLGKICVTTSRDFVVSTFLCTLALEYIDLSKRYLPELINFIRNMLILMCPSPPLPIVKPFKSSNKGILSINRDDIDALENENKQQKNDIKLAEKSPSKSNKIMNPNLIEKKFLITAEDFHINSKTIDKELKIKIIKSYLRLILVLIDKYSNNNGCYLIFNSIHIILKELHKNIFELINDKTKKVDVDDENSKKLKENDLKTKSSKDQNVIDKSNAQHKTCNTKKLKTKGDIHHLDMDEEIKNDANIGSHTNLGKTVIDNLLIQIQEVIDKLDRIKEECKFTYLCKEKEKPKILRLFEPEIKPISKYHTKGNQKEREKLLNKYKKEMKGAIREIRKDNKFIQKVKLKTQIKEDNVRKRKVKEILGICSNQEGEIRNIKRKK